MKIQLFFLGILAGLTAVAQKEEKALFPDITPALLSVKQYSIDTGAAAVVLAETGHSRVTGNKDGGLSVELKVRRRIHILKNSAYDQATISLLLMGREETAQKLTKIQAQTWNLENGRPVESKLNTKTGIFTEEVSRILHRKKFTLPNVKEGSVIDVEYTIVTPFELDFSSWYFQGSLPVLWSQYRAEVPQFLEMILIQQGFQPYAVEKSVERQEAYVIDYIKEVYGGKTVPESLEITTMVADYTWAMKDVPAFREEVFTSSIQNYLSMIRFQLTGYRPPMQEKKMLSGWPQFAEGVRKQLDWEKELASMERYWPAELKEKLKGAATETAIVKVIFNYVRDNYSLLPEGAIVSGPPLFKKISQAKAGYPGDINLWLTGLLNYLGLQADPVILSTRENGFTTEDYPVVEQFNHIICRVKADEDYWLLDASHPYIGFGKLPANCYNGQLRVLNKEATLLHLYPYQLIETTQSSVSLSPDPTGQFLLKGRGGHQYGYYASAKIRERINREGEAEKVKILWPERAAGYLTDSLQMDKPADKEQPLTLQYSLAVEKPDQDPVYIRPEFPELWRSNPFVSADRKYPVELPYRISQRFDFRLEIPAGYKVDELPGNLLMKFKEKEEVIFSCTAEEKDRTVQIGYSLEISRTVFTPAEYKELREFFSRLVAKMQEQVVLKKM